MSTLIALLGYAHGTENRYRSARYDFGAGGLPRIVERLDQKEEWKQARIKLGIAELKGDGN